MEIKEINDKLLNFLNKAQSEFHSTFFIKEELKNNGFIELKEEEKWSLQLGKNYFVSRGDNAFIAFKLPLNLASLYFKITSAHTDSPTFKVKENPTIRRNGYQMLKVEGYGGMIISSWFDKPLSLAGRVIYSKGEEIKTKLIDIDKNLLSIPSLAIHQNREVNEGYKYNVQNDVLPIIGEDTEEDLFYKEIKTYLKEDETLLSYDLYLVNRQKADYSGINNDYIAGGKLDDLASLYVATLGFIDAKDYEGINVMVGFDNEEVGSLSYSGADSNFLSSSLKRISFALNKKAEDYLSSIAKSFVISADNAHAIHYAHPEKSDDKNQVLLNKGIVIKYHANMAYTSDGYSSSILKKILNDNKLDYQVFFNRSDARSGSTLGRISLAHFDAKSVDIGLPQLAMHSSYETMGAKDTLTLYKLMKAYYEASLDIKEETTKVYYHKVISTL